MNKLIAAVLVSLAAACSVAPSTSPSIPSRFSPTTANRLVVPDAFEAPLVQGSYVPRDCRLERVLGDEREDSVCVAFQMSLDDEYDPWNRAYIAVAERAGWTLTEESGGIYYFDKPDDSAACRHRLMIVPYTLYPMDGDAYSVSATQFISAFAFDHFRDPDCAAAR